MCVSALKFLQRDVKVNLKLQWRPQPIRDDRLMGQLQREVAGPSGTEIKGGYMDFRWQTGEARDALPWRPITSSQASDAGLRTAGFSVSLAGFSLKSKNFWLHPSPSILKQKVFIL